LGLSDEAKMAWYRHWTNEGLRVLEAQLAGSADTGRFCHGDMPTLADCCLVPQVFNARRFDIDLGPYPTVAAIDAACVDIPAFRAAHPARQADAQ
jgi:maleylacetoacetate isomerase